MNDPSKTLYQQGEHLCMLYNHPEEQLATAVEYIRGGLASGEQCLFICGECSADDVRNALRSAGIDPASEEARGALLLKTSDAYLSEGAFDPDEMIALLDHAIQDASKAGFTGFRGAGDMSWLLAKAPGSQRLAEYEARLNDFYHSRKAVGLCFYNCNALPSEEVDHALATHKHVRVGTDVLLDNPFFEPDYKAMRRTAAKPEIVTEKLDILDAMRVAAQA